MFDAKSDSAVVSMSGELAITYRLLRNDDINDVIELLVEHYMPYEPLSKCLNMTKEEMRWYADEAVREVIPVGISLGAFDDVRKTVCGVTFGKLDPHKNLGAKHDGREVPVKVEIMQRFEEWSESTLSTDLGSTNFVIADLLVVSTEYSNRKIGTELSKRQMNLFAELGFDFSVGFATSEKSLMIDKRIGYKCAKKINMLSYRDSDTGETVFAQAELKDNCVHVMYKDLREIRSKKLNSLL
ncbi:uncharacterized protein LOC100177367 [Ciona intestinalis]